MSNTYSIKDLEHLTGVKAHTIRIWEQRYGIVSPKRTETNIRFYDSDDLKNMLNISLLNNNGFKISKIAKMQQTDIHELVVDIIDQKNNYSDQINALTIAMIDFDEEQFEKVMATDIIQFGFESTIMNIVFPFLIRVGGLWQTNAISPSQEHFISNLIRQKLIANIDRQVKPYEGERDKYLLYLPERELHELTLLFSAYLIKTRGNTVVYLGQTLPMHDLKKAYSAHQPQYIMSVFTSYPELNNMQNYMNELSVSFPEATIFLSGYQVVGQDFEAPENVIILPSIERFIELLEELKKK